MKEIKRRDFGQTGLKVTEVSLGAMNLRTLDDENHAKQVIHRALDLGINLIDTARAYNEEKEDGRLFESEVFVGDVINQRVDLSEPIIIITKGHGYKAKDFDGYINTSRNKLGITNFGDLKIGDNDIKLVYFFHGISKDRWKDMIETGALELAKKRREEGYFNYLGFSSHNGHEEVVKEAIESGYFDVIELPYNVFSHGFSDDLIEYGNIFKLAHDEGIAIINMKAFGGNGMVDKSNLFDDYCDISTQNRLLYCLSNNYISTVDAGCRFIEELELDVKVSHNQKLSKQECLKLEESAKKVNEVTKNTCRECTHCLEKFECPAGINFPEILALHTRYILAKEFNGDIEEIKNSYSLIENKADECTKCAQCNIWCEYKLDIPELLERTHELLARK